jgi:hypothetical protein
MKYVVQWMPNSNTAEESQARSLQVFSKWSPSEGATFREFLGRVDNQGGFAVVETDDPTLIAKDAASFSAWFDFSVYPVLDMEQAVAIDMEALEFRASIT